MNSHYMATPQHTGKHQNAQNTGISRYKLFLHCSGAVGFIGRSVNAIFQSMLTRNGWDRVHGEWWLMVSGLVVSGVIAVFIKMLCVGMESIY